MNVHRIRLSRGASYTANGKCISRFTGKAVRCGAVPDAIWRSYESWRALQTANMAKTTNEAPRVWILSDYDKILLIHYRIKVD